MALWTWTHYGIHVHCPKRLSRRLVSTHLLLQRGQGGTRTNTGKYIGGVSRDEYKLHDVTMPIDDVIECYEKKALREFLTDPRPKNIFTSKYNVFVEIFTFSFAHFNNNNNYSTTQTTKLN